MNFLEQVFTVWRALAANKLRSGLTLLGIIMGVGTIVLLSSLIAGGLDAIGASVSDASGQDLITVRINQWRNDTLGAPGLSQGDLRAVSGASGLARATVVPQLERNLDAKIGEQDVRVWLMGTNEGALALYRLELAKGRFLTASDRFARRKVAVVGEDVARHLNSSGDGLGEVHIGTERFDVVGILSHKPSINVGNRSWSNAVAIPDATFEALNGESNLAAMLVKTNVADPDRLKLEIPFADRVIRSVLAAHRHPNKSVMLEDARGDSTQRGFLLALQVMLWTVAALCLGVGGINIMNIMLVTVTERTREIGLRLAIGARKRDIQRQFLFEAAAISALGGLLGVAGGVVLGWAISFGLTRWLGYWPYRVDGLAVAIALGSAIGTGLIFGWYPARAAASLQPIECLRYE